MDLPLGRNEYVSRSAGVLEQFLSIQLLLVLFAQKFSIPLGEGGISLCLVSFYVGVFVVVLYGSVDLSPLRLIFLTIFVSMAVMSQLVGGREFSANSLFYIIIIYIPFVFLWRLQGDAYLRVMNVMQTAMLFVVGIILLQLVWQGVFGFGKTLNIERIVPEVLLTKGYIYEGPIRWGSKFVRPNGFFFLEPSFVSLFLACAILIEIAYFRRLWRLAAFAVGLIGCLGATGVGLLILAMPFVLLRQPPKIVMVVIAAFVVVAVIIAFSGLGTFFVGRLSELSSPTSSGWARIVSPILQLSSAVQGGQNIITGQGAGNTVEGESSAWWPIVKLSTEYGVVIAMAFFVFVSVSVWRAENLPLAVGLFLTFNFTGGYLVNPVMVFALVLLASTIVPVGLRPGPRWSLFGPREPEYSLR